jgi:CheY-like chemotaxis protein
MEAIGQLAGGVAHDFNNLLQAILGYSELGMIEVKKTKAGHQEFAEISHAAQRASHMVQQLLIFSRRQSIERKYINLNNVIHDLIKILNRVLGEHYEIIFTPCREIDTVHADTNQIEQILMNLCVNARDAMPTGGRIAIETGVVTVDALFCQRHPWAVEGKYVVFSVEDSGCGIPEALQDRVFDPFFTTKAIGKGTGLGLATVYGIVKQHEGLIYLYSEVNKGTVFKIFFPSAEKKEDEKSEPLVETSMPGGGERILVAEDEEYVRKLIVSVLERSGYQVLVAADGEEAIRVFLHHPQEIDLVLCDVIMPKASGKKVYETITSIRPDLPFLFCSGYSRTAIGENLLPQGEVEILLKPYPPQDLLRRIREILRNKHDGQSK